MEKSSYKLHTRKFSDCTLQQATNVAKAFAKAYNWFITGFYLVEY